VASGIFRKGDEVLLLPSGFTTRIRRIDTYDGELEEAMPPASVTMLLEDDFDLGRGDMIVREHNKPEITQDVEVMVCWFSDRPLQPNGKYILKHTSSEVRCIVKEIRYKLDINTLSRNQQDLHIGMNDIARVLLRTTRPLFLDSYRKNRTTGSLIDEATNETAGAGMII
jgi:sulfate adenylyltransferase subunit 1